MAHILGVSDSEPRDSEAEFRSVYDNSLHMTFANFGLVDYNIKTSHESDRDDLG